MGFSKPKTPQPTAQEKELERRQRQELDKLTDQENARLKSMKRGARGRRMLMGSSNSKGPAGPSKRAGSGRARSRPMPGRSIMGSSPPSGQG